MRNSRQIARYYESNTDTKLEQSGECRNTEDQFNHLEFLSLHGGDTTQNFDYEAEHSD